MPTGLTAEIYEGKKLTLREFALRCAKQFSPAHMYEGDLPLDKPPVLKGSDYYKLAIKRTNEKLTRLEHLRKHLDEAEHIIEQERQDTRSTLPPIRKSRIILEVVHGVLTIPTEREQTSATR